MKKLMFAVAALVAVNCLAEEAAKAEPAKGEAVKVVAEKPQRGPRAMTPEMMARREAREAEMAGVPVEEWRTMSREDRRLARDAKLAGVTREEWAKLDQAARREKMQETFKARRAEHEKRQAEKLGISVEEYQKQMEARRKELLERRQKMMEERRKQNAAAKAECAEKCKDAKAAEAAK